MNPTRVLVSLALALFALQLAAQDYPSRPVRIVVPFSAGGPNDIIARLVAHQLGEALGQQMVIDNRPGAGGNIGTDSVAKAPADGYTLLSAGPGSLITNPLIGKVPYDTARDFAPVGAGEIGRGADRARPGAAGPTQLRLGRPGQQCPPGGGALRGDGGRRSRACALPGTWARPE